MIDRIEVNIDGGLDIPLPRMARVRQLFDTTRIDDITQAVAAQYPRAKAVRFSISAYRGGTKNAPIRAIA